MPRVRAIHTSDLHLRRDAPEGLRIFDAILAEAGARAADFILVSGDLFDSTTEAIALRQDVRQRIESIAPLPVVLLPGNTDVGAYGPETDYGSNAVILRDTPWHSATVCGVEILGVPHQQGRTLAECLVGAAAEPRHTILAAHGNLMTGVADTFCGDGEDGAWMPIFASDLERRCSWAALGHLHSGRRLVQRDGERLVAYPGAPRVTSRKESGPRGVLAVDFETAVGVVHHEFVPLRTPFQERVEVVCIPGMEKQAVEDLTRRALEFRKPGARVLACLSGFVTIPEDELHEMASTALERAFRHTHAEESDADPAWRSEVELEIAARSFAHLAEVPVVAEFIDRIQVRMEEGRETNPEVIQAALQLGLDAFLEGLS